MGDINRPCGDTGFHERHKTGTERAYDPSGSWSEDVVCSGIQPTYHEKLAIEAAAKKQELREAYLGGIWQGWNAATNGKWGDPEPEVLETPYD